MSDTEAFLSMLWILPFCPSAHLACPATQRISFPDRTNVRGVNDFLMKSRDPQPRRWSHFGSRCHLRRAAKVYEFKTCMFSFDRQVQQNIHRLFDIFLCNWYAFWRWGHEVLCFWEGFIMSWWPRTTEIIRLVLHQNSSLHNAAQHLPRQEGKIADVYRMSQSAGF